MSSMDDSNRDDSATDVKSVIKRMFGVTIRLGEVHARLVNQPPPILKFTAKQWLRRTLNDERRCHNNLCMSPLEFKYLHRILVDYYGLRGTGETSSKEALAKFV